MADYPVTVITVPRGLFAAISKLCADHVGAVFHDLEAHAGGRTVQCANKSHAVVGDAQQKAVFLGDQRDIHQARVAMACRIGQRLLGDAIEVARIGFRRVKPAHTSARNVTSSP